MGIKIRADVNDRIIAEIEARKKLRGVVNYVHVFFGSYINTSLEGWNQIKSGVMKGVVGRQLNISPRKKLHHLDLDLKVKMRLIKENANIYEHVSDSLRAYEIGDSSTVIKELYLIIDSRNLLSKQCKQKYSSLRNSLSHEPLNHETICKLKRDWQGYFVVDSTGCFDYGSNSKSLFEQARILLAKVLPIIEQRYS